MAILHSTVTLSSPSPFVSLFQVTMEERIWESLSANERCISPVVSLRKACLCLEFLLKNVILSGVESIPDYYKHHLWYCSHIYKYHHRVAGSPGLAAMARTLLPAADHLSRSPPLVELLFVIDDTHTVFRHRAWLGTLCPGDHGS